MFWPVVQSCHLADLSPWQFPLAKPISWRLHVSVHNFLSFSVTIKMLIMFSPPPLHTQSLCRSQPDVSDGHRCHQADVFLVETVAHGVIYFCLFHLQSRSIQRSKCKELSCSISISMAKFPLVFKRNKMTADKVI